ncbi:MAG: hypothetical protein KF788_12470 [Piscinibacter sp.]|nr:hypothetical protein [Piscinibacter sp.]
MQPNVTGRRAARLAPLAALALALVACGGGGDSGTPPPPNVAVTAANQDSVTRAGMVSMQGGVLGSSFGIASADSASPAAVGPLLRRALAGSSKRVAAARKTVAVVVGPITDACTVSGTFTGTIDDRNNDGVLNSGDSISITFTNCVEVAGEVLNGRMAATYTQVVATPVTIGATVVAENLSFTDATTNTSASLNGGFNMTYTEPGATVAVTRIVVPDQLALGATTPVYSDTVTLLDGYTVESTYDSSALPPGGATPGRTSSTASGPVASTAAGGFVRFTTIEPLVQYDVDDYPRSGRFEAVGTTGKLRATVLSGTEVQIELDANGDGTFEASKTLPWTDLL